MTPRADGGTHDPETLMPLCGAHHRAVHDGALVVTGTWSSGFVFRHADGRAYGAPVAERSNAAVMRDAFTALRGLGFRETEVRKLLDEVRADVPADATLEQTVRLALARAPMPSCVREEVVPYQRCA